MSISLPPGVSRADFDSLLNDKYDGSTENQHLLRRDINELASGVPLAYVIGWIPFLGLRIHLDSHPLIPRPETEWWAEELIRTMRKRSGPLGEAETESPRTFSKGSDQFRLLDLCAGSGAVGSAVLHEIPEAEVWFGEIDPAHEATIRKNIEENGLNTSRAHIKIGDLFAPFAGETFDIIAVNPPYIPEGRELDGGVTDNEPGEALFAGADGLAVIRRIAAEAKSHLNEDGELWMECDTTNIEEAKKLVLDGGAKSAEIRTDTYGRERIVVGYF